MKVIAIVLCASLASIASADPVFDADGFYSTNLDPIVSPALITEIEVSGIGSYHEIREAGNVIIDVFIGSNHRVTGIGWDVTIEAFSPSWYHEMGVELASSTGDGVIVVPGEGDTFSGGPASYSSNGIIDFISQGLDYSVNADGILRLEFFEDFDDWQVNPDGVWNSGTITVQHVVPAPSSFALLGFGGLVAVRRRRRKVQF